jgi:MinD-like ATPase involved in chromosome partitioning or flagellar assembly
MHIATFYSFKGGVGRTQALVNVGVELAQRGRRVLLVDFDLEAPGIDSYPLPKPKEPAPGIVEFVTEYMLSGEAPDATRHIYECRNAGQQGGRLWVMPSGHQDDTYARRLSEIDWRMLYSEGGGYVLFEDLKLQWEQALAPDYVLIDSRTGHSDVSGICTRQLPDSVVILFFPTDQNLRGLPKVVEDIRSEHTGPRKKAIDLLFVMSNIPDLDDEDQILGSRITLFAETLHYDRLSAIIHRYDSLALLNQVIFTADRPKSRLAREYHTLTDRLIEQNLNDREGALAFIRKLSRQHRVALKMSRTDIESRLSVIRRTFEADKDVLRLLADLRMSEGRVEEASTLWNQLVDMKEGTPHVLLRRAESRVRTARPEAALQDLDSVLHADGVADYQLARALSLLASLEPSRLRSVASAPAVQHLEADRKLWVASQLATYDEDGLHAAKDILWQLVRSPEGPAALQAAVRHELSIVLMGLGEVEDARALLRDSMTRGESVSEAFNYAMATWASEGSARHELFEPVLALDKDNGSANYAECLAVALAILGRSEDAQDRLNQARQRLATRPEPATSCWRYRIVSPDEFLKDLDEIGQFIGGTTVRPRFFDQVPTPS